MLLQQKTTGILLYGMSDYVVRQNYRIHTPEVQFPRLKPMHACRISTVLQQKFAASNAWFPAFRFAVLPLTQIP